MSSGTTCVSGCEVVSKLGLRKGQAGKTRCLNLTAVNCLARFTLAWSWQPTPCGAWLARHSPCSSSGASAAVRGVGARGGPQGRGLAGSPGSWAPWQPSAPVWRREHLSLLLSGINPWLQKQRHYVGEFLFAQ